MKKGLINLGFTDMSNLSVFATDQTKCVDGIMTETSMVIVTVYFFGHSCLVSLESTDSLNIYQRLI